MTEQNFWGKNWCRKKVRKHPKWMQSRKNRRIRKVKYPGRHPQGLRQIYHRRNRMSLRRNRIRRLKNSCRRSQTPLRPFIFVIALFGTNVVRKCASTLSVLIIIGLVLVLVPNIIAQWGDITASIHTMSSGEMTVLSSESGAFGPALYSAVLYFFFQLASVSVMYQHMEDVTDEKQINKAAIWMFVCNFCAMELSILGLLAIAYVSELASASVPMLVLVQNGVGAGILTPIISLLIILGAISTAVNMISGIVTRCVNAVERRMDSSAKKAQGHLGRNAVFTAIFTFLAFAIAQFGLMTVVKKGYAYLGYAAFITLFVPFVVHAVATKGKEI